MGSWPHSRSSTLENYQLLVYLIGGNLFGGPFKSAPAQKARPSPVTTPTRRDGSESSHDQMACSSWWPAPFIQLSEEGRDRVTRTTCVAGKESFAKKVDGGWIAKDGAGIVVKMFFRSTRRVA